jgi:phosphinothricin acetyltransferase
MTTTNAPCRLRPGAPQDAAALATILNHYLTHTTATFHTEPVDVQDRRRFIVERPARHPIWVAEVAGEAVGWAALSMHWARPAFGDAAEHSIYVHPAHVGRGIGLELLQRAISSAQELGFHTLIGGVCIEQGASLALHERAGFVRVAHFREVARKFDRWLDVVYLQRMLHGEAAPQK